jgi:hypothetical protein
VCQDDFIDALNDCSQSADCWAVRGKPVYYIYIYTKPVYYIYIYYIYIYTKPVYYIYIYTVYIYRYTDCSQSTDWWAVRGKPVYYIIYIYRFRVCRGLPDNIPACCGLPHNIPARRGLFLSIYIYIIYRPGILYICLSLREVLSLSAALCLNDFSQSINCWAVCGT